MTRVGRPEGELTVTKKFSWEGFCKLDIAEVLDEVGFSKAESRRLWKDGAIKIYDTRVTPDGFVWYKRKSEPVELAEPYDLIFAGRRVITILPEIFNIWERIYYRLRDKVYL